MLTNIDNNVRTLPRIFILLYTPLTRAGFLYKFFIFWEIGKNEKKIDTKKCKILSKTTSHFAVSNFIIFFVQEIV